MLFFFLSNFEIFAHEPLICPENDGFQVDLISARDEEYTHYVL